MSEIVSLRVMAGSFVDLSRVAVLADWGKKRGQDKRPHIAWRFGAVVSLFYKGFCESCAMCSQTSHIALLREMKVFRGLAAHCDHGNE